MLRAGRFFENRQRAAVKRFGFGVVAHRPVKRRQVVEANCGVGMLRAGRSFENRQRAAVKRFGFGVVAHRLVKLRQVVEANCGVEMLRAICLFTDLQELPSNEDRLLVFTRVVKLNNLLIEGISLRDFFRLSRQAGCHPQRAMQNKEDCQRVPRHPETGQTIPRGMLARQQTWTHRVAKIRCCPFILANLHRSSSRLVLLALSSDADDALRGCPTLEVYSCDAA